MNTFEKMLNEINNNIENLTLLISKKMSFYIENNVDKQNIMQNIINNEYKSNCELFKYKVSDELETECVVENNKNLKNIADSIKNLISSNCDYIYLNELLLKLINNLFNNQIDKYINLINNNLNKSKHIHRTYILFILRSNNVIRLLHKNILFSNNSQYLDSSISDDGGENEYSIMINPYLKKNDWTAIYCDILILIKKLMQSLKYIFFNENISNPLIIYNLLNFNKLLGNQELLIKQKNIIMNKLNKSNNENIPNIIKCNEYKYDNNTKQYESKSFNLEIKKLFETTNTHIVYLYGYKDDKFAYRLPVGNVQYCDYKNTNLKIIACNSDFVNLNNILPQFNSKYRPLYYSYSENNTEPINNDKSYVLFSLKINFMIIIKYIDNKSDDMIWLFNPSDILNISIPTLNNRMLLTLFNTYNNCPLDFYFSIAEYSLNKTLQNKTIITKFYGESLYFLFYNISSILFNNTNFCPWNDNNYIKHLNLLIFFIYLQMFSNTGKKITLGFNNDVKYISYYSIFNLLLSILIKIYNKLQNNYDINEQLIHLNLILQHLEKCNLYFYKDDILLLLLFTDNIIKVINKNMQQFKDYVNIKKFIYNMLDAMTKSNIYDANSSNNFQYSLGNKNNFVKIPLTVNVFDISETIISYDKHAELFNILKTFENKNINIFNSFLEILKDTQEFMNFKINNNKFFNNNIDNQKIGIGTRILMNNDQNLLNKASKNILPLKGGAPYAVLDSEKDYSSQQISHIQHMLNINKKIIILPLPENSSKDARFLRDKSMLDYSKDINDISKEYIVNGIFPIISNNMLTDDKNNLSFKSYSRFINALAYNLLKYLVNSKRYFSGMEIYICSDNLLDYHNYIHNQGIPGVCTCMADQITSRAFNRRGINVFIDAGLNSGYKNAGYKTNFRHRIEILKEKSLKYDYVLIIPGFNDFSYYNEDKENLFKTIHETIETSKFIVNPDLTQYNDEREYCLKDKDDNIIIIPISNSIMKNDDLKDIYKTKIFNNLNILDKYINDELTPSNIDNNYWNKDKSIEEFESYIEKLITNIIDHLNKQKKEYSYMYICSDNTLGDYYNWNYDENGVKTTVSNIATKIIEKIFYEKTDYKKYIKVDINGDTGYFNNSEKYTDYVNRIKYLEKYNTRYPIDCIIIIGGLSNFEKKIDGYTDYNIRSTFLDIIYQCNLLLNSNKLKIEMTKSSHIKMDKLKKSLSTTFKEDNKNIIVLSITDFHKSGYFSDRIKERNRSNIIDNTAAEYGYLVYGIFPVMNKNLWLSDNSHFTLDGHRIFVERLSYNLRVYLTNKKKYENNMTLYIITDSTFGHHNWEFKISELTGKYKQIETNAANVITHEVFNKQGFDVVIDAVGNSGYVKSYDEADPRYGSYPKRIQYYIKNNPLTKFDFVLIVGGYNDLSLEISDNEIMEAVKTTFKQSEQLLKTN